MKDNFNIPEHITYLNSAAQTAIPQSVVHAGHHAIAEKAQPYRITGKHYFGHVTQVKQLFAKLINCDNPERITTAPSVSYSIANIANNCCLKAGDEIVIMGDQFPSNVYMWQRLAKQCNAKILTVANPKLDTDNANTWNTHILDAITEKTAVVAMGQIHWENGTMFNLKAIRKKTRHHNALLIIDGSQSIGALPFSVNDLQPDALVCAGYKWLLGPYGSAFAYFGKHFDNGVPIEDYWSNHEDAENFAGLTNYNNTFKPFANRYMSGGNGSFIHTQMQIESLKFANSFSREDLQQHCHNISKSSVNDLRDLGFTIEDDTYRAKHLFGIKLPKNIDSEKLKQIMQQNNVFVSFRGEYIRLSAHFYNTEAHFNNFVNCVKQTL